VYKAELLTGEDMFPDGKKIMVGINQLEIQHERPGNPGIVGPKEFGNLVIW
jgi:hypothetical protein